MENTFIIAGDKKSYTTLFDRYLFGLFAIPWEIRNYKTNKIFTQVKLIRENDLFYVSSKIPLICSHTYYYSLVPTNETIYRSMNNLSTMAKMN